LCKNNATIKEILAVLKPENKDDSYQTKNNGDLMEVSA